MWRHWALTSLSAGLKDDCRGSNATAPDITPRATRSPSLGPPSLFAGAAAFSRLAVPLVRDRATGGVHVVLDQPSVLRGCPRQPHLVGCNVGQHHPCDVGALVVHGHRLRHDAETLTRSDPLLSVASWLASPFNASYCASKSAEWALTNALRVELRAQGTLVVGVHAGFIDSDMACHRRRSQNLGARGRGADARRDREGAARSVDRRVDSPCQEVRRHRPGQPLPRRSAQLGCRRITLETLIRQPLGGIPQQDVAVLPAVSYHCRVC
jgi:NAD(P)-dependent dehydrogenase (short-subunit alcohol dehydrogenase family)